MPRSLDEQIRNKCIHFNGTQNDACEVGMAYSTFRQKDGYMPIPCLRGGSFKGETVECPKRQWPTDEEVKAELDEHAAHTKKFMAVLPIIQRLKKDYAGKNWSGVEPCPVCGGKLHLSIAGAYNGHVHGSCETPDCLRWME